METVKANICEVLYHNWKFNENYWCLSFELRNKYELWNSNWTLHYVILLKVPSEYISGNGADIISKDVEKSLIDTWYENLYSVEGSNSDSHDSESDLIYLKQTNKIFKYTVFCINLKNLEVRCLWVFKFAYQRKINWYTWQQILMLVNFLLRYLRLRKKCLILSVTIRKLVRSYMTWSFIWTIMKLKNSKNFIKEKAVNGNTCFLTDIINELLLLHY